MLSITTLCVVCFFEMLISYIFFSKLGERKFKISICFAIGTLLFESAALLNIMLSNTVWLNTLYFAIINIVFSFFCFRIKMSKCVFYSILLDTLTTALEYAVIFVISVIGNTEVSAYNNDLYLLIIEGSICKLLYFITCMLLLNFIKSDKSQKFPISFHIYPLTAIVTLTAFWYLCFKENLSYNNRLLLAILSIALFGSIVMLFITYQHNVEKDNEYFLLRAEYDKMNTERTYYDILEHQNQQLMIYAHDTKNHLTAIKGLNTDTQIEKYIDCMLDNLKKYSNTGHSGNKMLDVILSKYVAEAEIKSIDFSFDVRIDNLIFVDDFDLVTILDNLLDNAVESAEQSSAKTISFVTDMRNSYTVIITTNSCDKQPVSMQSGLQTTKKDKRIHGFGLKSVAKVLKKYQGDYNWEYLSDTKQFIVTVMLRAR